MNAKMLLVLGVAGMLGGCVAGPIDATYNLELAPFEDVAVPWFGCARDTSTGELQNPNCRPSDPVIFRFDARVRDAETQLPQNSIRVWMTSPYSRIFLLPQEVLEAINVPNTENWADVMNRGEIWAEFSGNYEGDYRPTYLETWTDNRGLATVWVWIDEMPLNASGQATAAEIQVSIASDTELLKLTAGQ